MIDLLKISETPLHHCCENRNYDMVKLILEYEPNLNLTQTVIYIYHLPFITLHRMMILYYIWLVKKMI